MDSDQVAAQPPSPGTIDTRSLWGLRIATGLFFMAALALSLLPELISGIWSVDLPFFVSLSYPAVFGLALWLLRGNPPSKFGLALTFGWGTLGSALVGAIACPLTDRRGSPGWTVFLVLLALLALQGSYGATSGRLYFRLGKERADWGGLASGFGVAALVVTALTWSLPSRVGATQGVAVISLRTINTAEETYAATYGGYSPNLAALGPPVEGKAPTANAAGLIDEVLARGAKGGYRFTYEPVPPDAKGQITSYTVCAEPVEGSGRFRRSFFTNETGVIRQTDETPCGMTPMGPG